MRKFWKKKSKPDIDKLEKELELVRSEWGYEIQRRQLAEKRLELIQHEKVSDYYR